ncbi:adenosine kinase-like [Daphnia pulex]|uniref:adenosine kinase-like n=1 Tax=Daphnia pulex TaxID=6669 RepID=UPI001EDFEAFE|nr:adenosine kinase-like [Daphnia pulex]XP_046445561.1 adenosine kinase-like [Daphnia pulex]XP_046445562.1 adenosine kinase-like [Daphnia pulex]XP_046445563.1 adenosine kinase-like [Daphnia pulex]XP_046445564.1 adenosine kinase-like [Daphnia pulex]XP_046445565.1 adenosine kinase-like [Daphnia pulex]XP_046445566.1 adenosine kinase-like [Daphnia pulex]
MPSGSINGHGRDEDSSGPVAIVAFGNALLDMSISVKDDSLIHKYGLPCDAQIEVTNEQQGLFSEVIQNYPVEYVAGGSAQNTVRILSRLIKNQWPSYVIGKIAHDPAGIILQKLLAQDGVITRYVFDEKLPTGCCVAIVRPGGTRCLAANIGAAREFNKENFVADMMDLIDRARILYVEGFFASHSPDVAMAALSRGHSREGLVRVVSLSAQYICLQSHSLLRRLLSYANLVVGNEDEFRALAGRAGLLLSSECESIASVARKVAALDYISPVNQFKSCRLSDFQGSTEAWDWSKLNERLAVVTCGASGVVCATRSESWLFPAEKLQPHLVKDTTGAGDAFLAGFFSQLLVGRPLDVCVATGQQTARIVITQTGCRLPV